VRLHHLSLCERPRNSPQGTAGAPNCVCCRAVAMLTFDQTLDLLHAWMGRSVSRWVNSSHDTVIYIVGTLARGEAQCPRFGEDVAATLKSHSSFICARVIG
jgi:hypothetical protein